MIQEQTWEQATEQPESQSICASTQNLGKRFLQKWALRDVTITLKQGEIVGLLGMNGAGKSTLIRILAGLQRPTQGRVEIMGHRPGLKTKNLVAYAPETNSLYGWMKVNEAVRMHASLFKDFSAERALALLQQLHIDPLARSSSLSKGQKTRVKLALTLARDARLYLLDEPLSGIDPASRRRILDTMIQEFRGGSSTLLLSTHQIKEAELLFDRVILLRQGQVVLEGLADDLREKHGSSLEELFAEVGE